MAVSILQVRYLRHRMLKDLAKEQTGSAEVGIKTKCFSPEPML
jgi:hypothetical protein